MIPTFKAGLVAATLSAVALVPAAGILTLASVDAAHAKNGGNGGNGNGGGGERGNGNGGRGSEARGADREARGGGRPEWAGSRGNGGGGRSESARGGRDPISNLIRGITGQEKRETRELTRAARKAPTQYAPQASIPPGKRPARPSHMHPSEIGNMNGALNANINAVLAHIRNGNVNGPVGSLAALAVADAALSDAQTTINEAALAEALGTYATVQAYYDSGVQDPAIDAALLALGVTPGEPYDFVPPNEDEVLAATGTLGDLETARTEAESSILSLWNKNTDTDPDAISPEEEALLQDLRDRLLGYETEIQDAMTEAGARALSEAPEGDEEASCEEVEGCVGSGEEEEVASAD